MTHMKHPAVVVIGDLVGSRSARDRRGLHRRLSAALEAVNERWGADLRVIAGDEYQGTLPTLGAALSATLDLRLALLPEHDVRHGVARGERAVIDPAAAVEDGPAWWAARAAIEAAKDAASRPATRGARTAYRTAEGLEGEPTGAVEAALLARDELVSRLDGRSVSVLRALLSGRTQAEAAAELGISPSAVSQRVRADALGVVAAMTARLEGLA